MSDIQLFSQVANKQMRAFGCGPIGPLHDLYQNSLKNESTGPNGQVIKHLNDAIINYNNYGSFVLSM